MTASTGRSDRSMSVAFTGLTAALVSLVAAIAFVVRAPSAPAIAEFQPSAQDRIEQAPPEQGGPGAGRGPAGCGSAPCDEEEERRRREIEVAAGRRCFGKPLRQTEDPHSPPCVFEIFRGSNGGATSQGVTASEIRVVIVLPSFNDQLQRETVEALIAHFNRRYEFYGRRIVPVFVAAWPFDNSESNTAAAEDILAQEPFGAVSTTLFWSSNAVVHQRLAEAQVISVVAGGAPGFETSEIRDGFTWVIDPPLDARLRAGVRFACTALAGRPASHAGAGLSGSARRFAVVELKEMSGAPSADALVRGLRSCGADVGRFDVPYWAAHGPLTNLMRQLRLEGYTSVIPVTPYVQGDLYLAATRTGYFPEWIDLGMAATHLEYVWAGAGRSTSAGQGNAAFGITSEVRVRPEGDSPADWAFREGGGGSSINVDFWYDSLLVLASGIQGAGPKLTPSTFAKALRTTTYPNPKPGGPPLWQQRIGFGPGDQVFHDDYAIWWWSEDVPSQSAQSASGRGSFCYIDRGSRFKAESFPDDTDARLFRSDLPCR